MARVTLILTVVTTVLGLLGGFSWLVSEWRSMKERRRVTGRWLVLACCLLLPDLAEAACSGSGLTWSCPAGTTVAEVNTALGSATDGATVTFADGAYSWATTINLSNTKATTLICESVWGCEVTVGGPRLIQLVFSGTNTKAYRISGFLFKDAAFSSYYTISLSGQGGTAKATNVRIDHIKFQDYAPDSSYMELGDFSYVNVVYGLVDHVTVTAAENGALFNATGAQWSSAPESSYAGQANNLFFEDNTMTFTSQTNAGRGCGDSWGGAAIVWRHNTTLNCSMASHGATHAGGPWNWEVYSNTFIVDSGSAGVGMDSGYRLFHHHGSGEMMVFDNVMTASGGKSGAALSVTHYRSATNAWHPGYDRCDGTSVSPVDGNRTGMLGYPCWRQPGRNSAAVLHPIYAWNNRWSDTLAKVNLYVEDPFGDTNPVVADHVAADRELYNAVSKDAQTSATSPFNGTTGMGFGTLANRPTTCTTGAAADAPNGGVGYWATDEEKLYRCSATDTWTEHYTPYTYPHPLQGAPVATDPRFYVRFVEVLLLVGSLAWKLRVPLVAGSLIVAQATAALPEAVQRTTYTTKVLAAKAILAVLPRRP